MRGWNWLFFKPGILMPDQQKSAEWNRGRYLVEGVGALRRLPYAEEHLWRGQARPGLWRRAGRAACSRRGSTGRAQRPEIVERGRHRRISAERPQRQEPCRRIDVGGRGQLDLEDERCRYPRHRGLPEGPAGRRAGAEGHPASAGANGRRRETLRRRLHRLPRGRWLGRAADLPAAARQRQPAIRPIRLEHAAHHPRRRGNRDDAARAEQGIDAGLCGKDVRPGDRRRDELHPQRLGQCGAAGDGGSRSRRRGG